MEQTNQKKSGSKALYVLIGFVCLAVFTGLIFWQYQKPERKGTANEQNQTTADNQASDIVPDKQQNVSAAENIYRQGAEQSTNKNYAEAIKYFDQAITENAYEPRYYSDKSEAQYNLGQKDQAISTLIRGSSLNPDSDLLKSKLDVLMKEQFSNPNIDATRE